MVEWTKHEMRAGKDRSKFELHRADVTVNGTIHALFVRFGRKGEHGHVMSRPYGVRIEVGGRTVWSADGFKDSEQAKRVALAYVDATEACPHCVGGWRFERDINGNLRDAPVPCAAC